MHSNKGVTLISLAITIIVIIIIVGTASYTGIKSLAETKRTAFITEVKMIKEKIDLYNEEQVVNIGKPVTTVSEEKRNKILASAEIGITSFNDFKYFDENELKKIQLTGIKNEYLINFKTKKVISVNGVKVDGTYRYTLHQVGADVYEPAYHEEQLKGMLDFNLSVAKSRGIYQKVVISDIKTSNYSEEVTIRYKEVNSKDWMIAQEDSFEVTKVGTYIVEVTDSIGNTKTKQIEVKVDNQVTNNTVE